MSHTLFADSSTRLPVQLIPCGPARGVTAGLGTPPLHFTRVEPTRLHSAPPLLHPVNLLHSSCHPAALDGSSNSKLRYHVLLSCGPMAGLLFSESLGALWPGQSRTLILCMGDNRQQEMCLSILKKPSLSKRCRGQTVYTGSSTAISSDNVTMESLSHVRELPRPSLLNKALYFVSKILSSRIRYLLSSLSRWEILCVFKTNTI
ncbi:hypothetical protein LX36DRAFT_32353 [Colletotrichum falcatum]|nr:hypothetical protein LX36DRAFT_32353 [Colletotrichum falcatum]